MTTPATLPGGVGVALVTFFGDDGRPDLAATAARAKACAGAGLTSVLVAGTTGEASRLSATDRVALARAVKDSVGDIPVLVGTGAPEAARALAITEAVASSGAGDALLVLVPGDMAPADFYTAIRARTDTPVLAYHFPAVSPPGVKTAEVPGLDVDGIKDSSADTNRLADLVETGVRVYVGSPTQLVVAGGCGAAGALLGVANVAPSLCLAAWEGDVEAQRALFAIHRRSVADFPGYLKATAPDTA